MMVQIFADIVEVHRRLTAQKQWHRAIMRQTECLRITMTRMAQHRGITLQMT